MKTTAKSNALQLLTGGSSEKQGEVHGHSIETVRGVAQLFSQVPETSDEKEQGQKAAHPAHHKRWAYPTPVPGTGAVTGRRLTRVARAQRMSGSRTLTLRSRALRALQTGLFARRTRGLGHNTHSSYELQL